VSSTTSQQLSEVASGIAFAVLVNGQHAKRRENRMDTIFQVEQIEEKEVLRLIALGNSGREIAEQLRTNAETVAVVKTLAMERLGLKNRIDVVRYVEGQGWIG
jgi:DNA-binding NarL/FixJ family response regulator